MTGQKKTIERQKMRKENTPPLCYLLIQWRHLNRINTKFENLSFVFYKGSSVSLLGNSIYEIIHKMGVLTSTIFNFDEIWHRSYIDMKIGTFLCFDIVQS